MALNCAPAACRWAIAVFCAARNGFSNQGSCSGEERPNQAMDGVVDDLGQKAYSSGPGLQTAA